MDLIWISGKKKNSQGQTCPNSIVHRLSLANKLDRPELIEFSANFNFLTLAAISVILFLFRKSQKEIDQEIDEMHITPGKDEWVFDWR